MYINLNLLYSKIPKTSTSITLPRHTSYHALRVPLPISLNDKNTVKGNGFINHRVNTPIYRLCFFFRRQHTWKGPYIFFAFRDKNVAMSALTVARASCCRSCGRCAVARGSTRKWSVTTRGSWPVWPHVLVACIAKKGAWGPALMCIEVSVYGQVTTTRS